MSGYVYFITPEAIFHRPENDEVRLVKIGYTGGDPNARLSALQCGSPIPLVLHSYIDGSPELEKAFHAAFAQHRMLGEWFAICHKLFDLLVWLEAEGDDKYLSRDRVVTAMSDVVFSTRANVPNVTDEEYCKLTDPEHLARFYPEVWK